MRGITRTLGALFAASALAAPVWAGVVSGEPDADMAASFDGDNTVVGTGWFTSFSEATPSAYVTAKQGQGFTVSDSVRPNGNATSADFSGDFSVAALVKLPTYSVSTPGTIFAVSGTIWQNTGTGLALGQTSTGLQVDYVTKASGNTTLLTTDTALEGWASLVVVFDRDPLDENGVAQTGQTTTTLYVNGSAVATNTQATTTPNGTWLALGNIYGGATQVSWAIHSGLVIDEVRGYSSALSATNVATLHNLWLPPTTEASRTVSGSTGTWSTASDWSPEGVPGENADVTLTVSEAATLTVDSAATIASLTVEGDGSLTLAATGSGSLTTGSMEVNATTDLSDMTTSLGSVRVAAGTTLTAGNATTLSELAGEATSQVIYDLTETLADDATRNAAIQTFPGVVTFKATGSTGATLAYDAASTVSLASCLAFDGGTHTFKYGRSTGNGQSLFATGRGDDLPTIDVKNGTTLNFYEKDLSGWNGTVSTNPAVIRVRNGGTLNFQDYGGSGFFRDRLVLDGGASVTMAGSNFILHGGTQDAAHAQIAMLDSETAVEATLAGQIGITNINGGQAGQKASTIAVGNNATLKASAKFVGTADGGSLTKVGSGTLELSSTETNTSNALTISAGKVLIKNGSSWGTGAITVAEGATLEVETVSGTPREVLTNTLTSNGNYVISGNGVATLGSARTLLVTSIVSPAKVRVTKQDGETTSIQVTTQLPETTWTNEELPFEVVDSEGASVTTYGGKVSAQGIVQIALVDTTSLPTATLGSGTTNLSELSWNATLTDTQGAVINTGTGSETVTLALDAALSPVPTSILITGTAPVTLTGDNALANVVIDTGTEVTVATPTILGSTVEVNGTLIVDCATALVESATVLSGSGKLIKRGTYDLVLNASTAHTFAGGTDIEAGKIGLSTGALGTGPIALKGTGATPAGLWLWAASAVTVANDVELSGNTVFYVPLARTLTLSGTVSGSGAATLTTSDGSTGTLLFSNAAVAACTYTGTWTIPNGTTLRLGNASANSANALAAGSTCTAGSEIIVEEGGTLNFNPWTGKSLDKTDSGKVTLTTKVTLNGGTLTMPDGSYVYNALNVTAASTVTATFDKGIVFKTFYGSGDLTVKALSSLYGSPLFAFWWPNEAGNANSVEYTGKLTFKNEANSSPVMQVVPDTVNCFKQAYLHFEGSNTIEMLMSGDRAVGALDGVSSATIKSANSTIRTLTVGADYTGTAASDSFAGTIADSVNLTLAANVVQAITGSLGTVTDGVASYSRSVTLNAGSELKLQSTVAQTITAAITGDGALTIGNGTNASAVTLSAANTYAGGTTVKAGANLVLNGTADDTAVLKEKKTVSVEQDGTLTLTKGISYITVAGDGEVVVDGTFTFGLLNSFTNTVSAPVTVNENATLQLRAWRAYALSVPTLTVNGTLKNDGYTDASTATLTVPAAGKLTGTGTIEMATTFEAGATLDVTNGVLTVSEAVTCAGTVTVAGVTTETGTILTCANPADVAEKFTGAPEGYVFSVNEAGTAVVLTAKPTIEIPKVDEVELSAESQATLLAAAEAAGLSEVTAVTGSTTVEGIATKLTAAQIDNALAVFGDSIVTADGTNKTLKVDYNFGIVAIEPNYFNGTLATFTVKVAVKTADGTLASLADGATIELVDCDTDATISDGFGGFADVDSDGMYEAYFSADPTATDPLIGRSFKVKASK